MHLNLNEITDTWVVKKPTADGEVTSIECFNKDRELMVQFFGLRKPGKPELEEWKTLVESL
ncbi:ChuX/HutX family heme-like substrate-binding protein [Cytophaga hutchinsonii]|jgi:putative hemin transport protein|uniref:Heme transport/degradation factor n=1 Tax=Cytophaga hutchinsonii (strain ATCC 33406 / DSM 1761 / CIP 103989 / NBRC 15051 / NCIMB 9469 / D465) TaxID=269798 RepID=A0A6N4SNU0_CYTH3|nr:ChuX/HutX family heme-like substrate-binding protein [Cytophaga hutchinsonii]ABG57952.1 heme transport/degradation factor [Cytophaga hutchinsonii ATCC 33406]SFX09878.1 putative hemin transport protein [Cytophaga hutchinsonii ATCC 33406]